MIALVQELEALIAKMAQPQKLPVLRADMAREREIRAEIKALELVAA
jgi:hypothetical protein